jgi:hypothetical protein
MWNKGRYSEYPPELEGPTYIEECSRDLANVKLLTIRKKTVSLPKASVACRRCALLYVTESDGVT